MNLENRNKFTVIENKTIKNDTNPLKENDTKNYHSNPMYEKLLNFRNLQEQQKKKFSVDDLFKLC
ncbi:hypothetical protein J6R97_03825 [bacterium]|nr:hypothetical protein [bacterium]